MRRPRSITWCCAWFGFLVAVVALQAPSAAAQHGSRLDERAVERELRVRAVAWELTSLASTLSGEGEPVVEFATVARVIGFPATEAGLRDLDWTDRVTILDAAGRAGLRVRLPEGAAFHGTGARVEVRAAALAVAPLLDDPASLAGAIAGGLGSPFRALQAAALKRLAEELAEGDRLRPLLAEIARQAFGGESHSPSVAGDFQRTIARTGAALGGAEAALLAADLVAPGSAKDIVVDRFLDWAKRPLDAQAIAAFRRCTSTARDLPERSLVEGLALIAETRDGVDVQPKPDLSLLLGLFREDAPWGTYEPQRIPRRRLDQDDAARTVARMADSKALGRVLMRVALGPDLAGPARGRAFRGAAWLLPAHEVLPQLLDVDGELAEEVLGAYGQQNAELPIEASVAWARSGSAIHREAIGREAGQRHVQRGEAAVAPILLALLEDPEPELRSLAFAWLCDGPRPVDHAEALWAAFGREADDSGELSPRQKRWLARLPRQVPLAPFRGLLLTFLGSPELRDPAVVELLGNYGRDPEVLEGVRAAFADEVEGLEAAEDYLGRLGPDGRGAALAAVLHRLGGAASAGELYGALLRAMPLLHGEDARGDARPQLPKTAVALLARTGAGRRLLPDLLADDVPRRVRFEAALQLAKGGAAADRGAVAARLMADFQGVDDALRMRALGALGMLDGDAEVVDAFLAARMSRGSGAVRLGALDALAARGVSQPMIQAIEGPLVAPEPDLASLDLALSAARGLGHAGMDRRPLATADASLRALDQVEAAEAGATDELLLSAFADIRGALLESILGARARRVAGGGHGPELGAAALARLRVEVLERAVEGAAEGLGARLAGRRGEDPRFRWRTEVRAFAARAGDAAWEEDVLRDGVVQGPLHGADSRLLLVLGDLSARAGGSAFAAEWLLGTGLFGVQGESPGKEAARDLFLGRLALVEVHARSAEAATGPGGSGAGAAWGAAAGHVARLLGDLRGGRVSSSAVEEAMGPRVEGIPFDPEARLVVLARVFRARSDRAFPGGGGEGPVGPDAMIQRCEAWARLDAGATASLDAFRAEVAAERRRAGAGADRKK